MRRLRPALLAAALTAAGLAAVPPTSAAAYEQPPSMRPAIVKSLAATRFPTFNPSISNPPALRAPEWWQDGCLNVSDRNKERCTYGPTNATRELAVVGDSIATSWLPGLRAAAAKHGWRLHVFTMQLCPTGNIPTYLVRSSDGVNRTCQNHRRWMLEQVQQLRPFITIASSSADGPNYMWPSKGADWESRWASGLTETLRVLAQASHKVVVVPSPPPTGALAKCTSRGRPADCVRGITTQWRQVFNAEHTAAKRAGANVRHPQISTWFCADGRCPGFVGTTPVMADGKHLAAAYGRRLTAHLDAALNS